MNQKRWKMVAAAAAIRFITASVEDADAGTSAAMPQRYLDTTMPVQSGHTITVAAGGDLQSALDSAQPGDTITLQAGATFSGNFTLPNKSGTGWIIVRSSADSSLPPQGTRVSPAFSSAMPKLTTSGNPVIATASGAHHFRFVGIEMSPTPNTYVVNLVQLGNSETSLSQLPHDIVFDRCYLHGDSLAGTRRGIVLNSASTAVVDSYLSDFKDSFDSQAVTGWNGPGPFKIVNNFLEAAAENLGWGGADPTIPNLVPSDIEIRANHISKPLSWFPNDPSYDGSHWLVKNLLELKNAQRVLIDGNLFENNWAAAQAGFAVQLTVRNQDGASPWSTVQDITISNNLIRHSSAGINLLGSDDRSGYPSGPTQRINLSNNLFDDIDPAHWGNGSGTWLQLLNGANNLGINNLSVDHNTLAFNTVTLLSLPSGSTSAFSFTNNLVTRGSYGVFNSSAREGANALAAAFASYVFDKNAVFGNSSVDWAYPSDNFFPASISDVGFVNPVAGGDFHLLAASPYKNAATDGRDIGANVDSIAAALSPSDRLNQNPAPTPTPSPSPTPTPTVVADTTAPSITFTTPSNGATVSGLVTILSVALDNVGVTMTKYFVDASLVAGYSPAVTTYVWNSASVADGTHTIATTAFDAAGNSRQATLSLVVKNDFTAPKAAITAPANGAKVSKTTKVTYTASDNKALKSVALSLDGSLLSSVSVNTSSYSGSASFNAQNLARGSHTLRLTATDASGNSSATTSTIYK